MCGLIGIVNSDREAVTDLYLGLLSMQHRGKESAGIATTTGRDEIRRAGGVGELPQAFWGEEISGEAGSPPPPEEGSPSSMRNLLPRSLGPLAGRIGIGHVRYGTTGSTGRGNIQPVYGTYHGHDFCLAHNGNLVNTPRLRRITKSPEDVSDTRVIADLLSLSSAPSFEEALIETVGRLEGAFSLILLFGGKVFGVKDPLGLHPLQIGRRKGDRIIASESCAFDLLGADLDRDIMPGELVVLDDAGCRSVRWTEESTLRIDIFEYIYFLRPDSVVHGAEAGTARYHMGRALAAEHPVEADIVVPVSDSGNHAALGYYEGMIAAGFSPEFRPWALCRPHTVSRTFIEPVQEKREQYLRLKFNPRPRELEGKSVVVIDDSVVRANTMRVVAGLLREGGTRQVHAVISSPMYRYPDFYGIDTYRIRDELIARRLNGSVPAIARELGNLDSLGYLSLEATEKAVLAAARAGSELTTGSFYTGPFTGEYPAGTGVFSVDEL